MTESERAKELARAVVLAQGNVFIKELLREKRRADRSDEGGLRAQPRDGN